MPDAEIARRGGAVKVRTQRLPDDRYRHIYVVRDAGPRGGHTVAGEVQQKKASGAKVKGDTEPQYKIKPNVPRRASGKR